MAGCGLPTKGSHPNDDLVPCGTRIHLGSKGETRTVTVLLCPKCQEKK